jgi:HEAT repeat protein
LSEGVVCGFAALGTVGAPAVPELVGILKREKDHGVAEKVIFCLGFVGAPARDALPVLTEIAERDPRQQVAATLAMRLILGTNAPHVQYF